MKNPVLGDQILQPRIKTVQKLTSKRLMENVHPAGFAAGRSPEE